MTQRRLFCRIGGVGGCAVSHAGRNTLEAVAEHMCGCGMTVAWDLHTVGRGPGCSGPHHWNTVRV